MTTTAKATTPKAATAKAATKARTRKPRTAAKPVVVAFPSSLLAYLDIAVAGPLGPGGVAHRITKFPVTMTNAHGGRYTGHLIGGACQPTTTRPVLDSDDETETVPVTECRIVSASVAQSLGVTRCTHADCWPVQPGETPGGAS